MGNLGGRQTREGPRSPADIVADNLDRVAATADQILREELRSRVLATRLLQRYGYLLPKVNPDSELAAERNLALQDRARQIARTERDTDSRQQIAPQQTANCDTGSIPDCDLLEQGTSRGTLARARRKTEPSLKTCNSA
jgi:hypothetical protein